MHWFCNSCSIFRLFLWLIISFDADMLSSWLSCSCLAVPGISVPESKASFPQVGLHALTVTHVYRRMVDESSWSHRLLDPHTILSIHMNADFVIVLCIVSSINCKLCRYSDKFSSSVIMWWFHTLWEYIDRSTDLSPHAVNIELRNMQMWITELLLYIHDAKEKGKCSQTSTSGVIG